MALGWGLRKLLLLDEGKPTAEQLAARKTAEARARHYRKLSKRAAKVGLTVEEYEKKYRSRAANFEKS